MSLIRCARTAAAVGKLAKQERDAMEKLWSREYHAAIDAGAHSANAEQQANDTVMAALRGIAAHQKRNAQLQINAQRKLAEDAARFRNLKGEADIGVFGEKLMRNVEATADALFRLDISEIGALAQAFGKEWLSGARKNGVLMTNVVREAFGEDTGDAAAKGFAEVWRNLNQKKIGQFNEAGGAVPIRDDWAMPVHHDTLAIATAGEEAWKAEIRQRTDYTRMTNPLTGRPLTAPEFEEALSEIWLQINANGFDPASALSGEQGAAMWRRRADPRFFVWKSADDWLAYHEKFGAGVTPFEVMTGWLRAINHDLAAMQKLGPNPSATVKWLGRSVLAEQAKQVRGEPALFPQRDGLGNKFGANGAAEYALEKQRVVEDLWKIYTGEANRPHNKHLAYAEATTSNLIYSAKLPFTVAYTPVDLINQAMTRAFVGLSNKGLLTDFIAAVKLAKNRTEIAELGLEIDTGLSAMGADARETAFLHGAAWSRWMADRVMTLGHLKPITQGLRSMWTLGNLHQLARLQKTAWEDLSPRWRQTLERYDIDAGAWEFIQATAPTRTSAGTNVVRIADIANTDIFTLTAGKGGLGESVVPRPGLTRGQEVALRVQRMIVEEGEYATVSGTIASRRIGMRRVGTVGGLLIGSWAKLKTYPISHFQHHGYRAANIFHRNGGGIRGAGAASGYYIAGLLVPSMLMVGMGLVLRDVLDGKDPSDVTDPDFWNRAFFAASSLGWAQDIFQGLFSSDDRINAFDLQGPLIGTIADFLNVGKESVQAMAGDEKAKPEAAVVRLGRNLTPKTWYTKLATDRLIWDNVQEWADPEAAEAFRRAEARLRTTRGQEYFWAPGANVPERSPNFGALDVAPFNADQDGLVQAADN